MGWINFFYSSIGAIPGPLVLGALLDRLWDRPRIAFFLCGITVVLIGASLGTLARHCIAHYRCVAVTALFLSFVLGDKWFTVEKHPHNIAQVVEDVKEHEEGF